MLLLATSDATLADDVAAGRALAENRCSRCHAVGPSGSSPLPAAPPFRTLHERYPVENLGEALGEGIFVGHSPMPILTFSPPEIAELLAYLQSLEGSAK